MLFTHEQEEIEVNALDIDLEVEEEKREIQSNLKLQHVWDVVKLQMSYKI